MTNSRRFAGLAAVALVSGMALAQPSFAGEDSQCALDSLVAITILCGKPAGAAQVRQVLTAGSELPSLLDLRHAAEALGVPLQGMRVSLDEIRERGGPALLHLQNPAHFLVLASIGARGAVIYDHGLVGLVPLPALASRYTGLALVLHSADVAQSGLAFADDPVRSAEATSVGQLVTAQVPISNRGHATLELEVASTSCACAGAELSARSVAPGATTTLTARINPRGWGTELETVMLRSSDPLWPRPVAAFEIRMPKSVLPVPERLSIRAEHGKLSTRSLTLLMPKDAAILACGTRQGFLSVRVAAREAVAGGTAHRVQVVVAADAPAGAFADEITFDLKDAGVARVAVPVAGVVEADIVPSPSEVFLGVLSPGARVKRAVTVRSRAGIAFSLKSVRGSDARVAVQARCGVAASQHEVKLEIAASGEPGAMLRDRVQIVTEGGGTIDFGVLGMIRAAEQTAPAVP